MTRPTVISCETCGVDVPVSPVATVPRFCGARCRKASYAGACEVCGARTDGSNGRDAAPKRCTTHNGALISARLTAKHGPTRDRIAAMYRDGATIEEVRDALGYTSIQATRGYIHRLRHWYGYDLPCRYPAREDKRVAA